MDRKGTTGSAPQARSRVDRHRPTKMEGPQEPQEPKASARFEAPAAPTAETATKAQAAQTAVTATREAAEAVTIQTIRAEAEERTAVAHPIRVRTWARYADCISAVRAQQAEEARRVAGRTVAEARTLRAARPRDTWARAAEARSPVSSSNRSTRRPLAPARERDHRRPRHPPPAPRGAAKRSRRCARHASREPRQSGYPRPRPRHRCLWPAGSPASRGMEDTWQASLTAKAS
jgi:hypothetical protein